MDVRTDERFLKNIEGYLMELVCNVESIEEVAGRENEMLAADLLVDNVVSKGDAWNLMGNIRSLIPV